MMNRSIDRICGARTLVVGGSGFIGAPLVRRLDATGCDVISVSRRLPNSSAGRVRSLQGDASEAGFLRDLFREYRPDFVFHLASGSRNGRDLALVDQSLRSDLLSVVEVLTAATEHPVSRLIVTASLEEPTEAEGLAPMSPYAAAKFAAGAYARMYRRIFDVPAVILRLFMGYGPGQAPEKVVSYLIDSAVHCRPAKLSSGSKRVDWVYIDDLVEAFLQAAICDLPENRAIDIGSGLLHSVREVAELIQELSPQSPKPIFGALPDRVGDDAVREADLTPARMILNWRAETTLREGLRRTLWHAREKLNLHPV